MLPLPVLSLCNTGSRVFVAVKCNLTFPSEEGSDTFSWAKLKIWFNFGFLPELLPCRCHVAGLG